MKCHVCSIKLIKSETDSAYSYYCKEDTNFHYHCIFHFSNEGSKNYYYNLLFGDNILIGYDKKFDEYTIITNCHTGEIIVPKVNFIPIDINNVSEEGPQLYNKLMRLKAFI